jgi:hypothetical protein
MAKTTKKATTRKATGSIADQTVPIEPYKSEEEDEEVQDLDVTLYDRIESQWMVTFWIATRSTANQKLLKRVINTLNGYYR